MEYNRVQLSDVAEILVGFAFKSDAFNTDGIGIRLVRGKNITSRALRWGDDTRWWNDFTLKLDRYYLQENDIVIGMDGSLVGKNYARIYAEDLPLLLVQRVACIRAKEGADQDYLWSCIASSRFEQYIDAVKTGTSIPHISGKQIGEYEIPLLTLDDQKKIGTIATLLEEKIRCNNKINDNLQQQAAALFANFYDRAETEVGFTEIIQILGGGTPKTGESLYWNGNVPFFTPKDVGLPYTLTTEKTITEEGLAHCNSRRYPINTVFVTARGTVGKVGLSGVPMAMNQSCYALVGKDTHQLLVYFYTLKAVDRLKHKASGAVFDAITTRDFESEIISKLSDIDAKAFLDIAEPIYRAVLSNSIENLRLAALRDSLLPKLMSGEIDVSDIQI